MKQENKMLVMGLLLTVVFFGCNQEAVEVDSEQISEVKSTAQKAVQKQVAKTPTPPPAKKASQSRLIVADFDSGDKPNNLGGDMGAWDKDPADETQSSSMSFESGDDAAGNAQGYSLRLDYDVDSPNPAYNGFWTKLEGEDLSSFSTLNFYLKGDAAKGFPSRIKIEIKDFQGQKAVYVASGITNSWKEYKIPFAQFGGGKSLDLSAMSELVIVFDDATSNPKVGSLLVDQITVS